MLVYSLLPFGSKADLQGKNTKKSKHGQPLASFFKKNALPAARSRRCRRGMDALPGAERLGKGRPGPSQRADCHHQHCPLYSICTVYVQYLYASEAYKYCTYTVHILYNGRRRCCEVLVFSGLSGLLCRSVPRCATVVHGGSRRRRRCHRRRQWQKKRKFCDFLCFQSEKFRNFASEI